MERIRQMVGAEGLQIPLVIMRRYGIEPQSGVLLELRPDGIHILPAAPGREDIENRALRYLLMHLGDAVTVEAQRDNGNWLVSVYGSGIVEPLGKLVYSPAGELLLDRSTPLEEMHRRSAEVVTRP